MTTDPTKQATETVYKATAESLRLAIQSARSARELAEEQARATRDIVRKTLPREALPYFEASERFLDVQVETADRFLNAVNEQVQSLASRPPQAQTEEVTKLVQAQMKLAAEQYEALAKIAKVQFDSVFATTSTLVPKEVAPLVAQSRAAFERQQELYQRTFQGLSQAVEISAQAAGKSSAAPAKKRK
ncbi:MAG: hypothetical protein ACREF4_20255 [Gammaproteobacteria bacterium]